MKKSLAGLLITLAAFLCFDLAQAAGPKLTLEHTVTGTSAEASAASVGYSLHVRNTGTAVLNDLTLSLVPRPPWTYKPVTVRLGDLAPRQETTVPLQLVGTPPAGAEDTGDHPLFWAAQCRNAQGNTLQFPAVSKPGGAK